MSYKITDEDRCLGFIKINGINFFVHTLQDDFILDYKKYFNEFDVLEETPIRSLLNHNNINDFISLNSQCIKSEQELILDFLDIFNDKEYDFWDLKDFHLLPSVVIDFDVKTLYQIDVELVPHFSEFIPNDWKSFITPDLLGYSENNIYVTKYPNLFYWITGDENYLKRIIEEN